MSTGLTKKGLVAACVHVVARPGGGEAMLDLLTRMSVEAAKDDGTEVWSIQRLGGGVEEFFVYECFRDDDAFARHRNNAALNTLGKELGESAERVQVLSGRLVGGLHPLL